MMAALSETTSGQLRHVQWLLLKLMDVCESSSSTRGNLLKVRFSYANMMQVSSRRTSDAIAVRTATQINAAASANRRTSQVVIWIVTLFAFILRI
jgi:hypothetical protein